MEENDKDDGFVKEANGDMDSYLTLMDPSEKRLNDLGYQQELRRVLTGFHNWCIGLSTTSLLSTIIYLFPYTLLNGGPAGAVWYWWIAAFFAHIIGLSLSEIASSFPTAGSLYFWAAAMAGPKWGPFAAWLTGYMEFFGLAVGCAGSIEGTMTILRATLLAQTGGASGGGYDMPRSVNVVVSVAVMLLCAALNCLSINKLAIISVFSFFWQLLLAVALIICLPLAAETHKSSTWVFTHHETNLDMTDYPSKEYSFCIALLVYQGAFLGYDAVAHMAEETKRSDTAGPFGIMATISTMAIFGWGVLLVLVFCIQEPFILLLFNPANETGGYSGSMQIIYDAFHGRYGNVAGVCFFGYGIVLVNILNVFSQMMCAARIAYAMARDNGLPLSSLWSKLSRHQVPVNAVLLTTVVAIAFVLPYLISHSLFSAIASMNVAAWFLGYAVPIFFRLIQDQDDFQPGPFDLTKWVGNIGCKLVHLVALLWLLYTVALLLIPSQLPLTWESFNYAPVGLGIFIGLFTFWWFIDARNWFTGPVQKFALEAIVDPSRI
eukprot:TRINITY_DN2589_c0_g1_i4.p1 TRINITY_DN2589_c0_g1~~TRINITY_DN2589_c0_g1_i4.p1  ORF type:complete len:560 (-),score=114.96 TRINITY_DN2589_c0_g1_i4:214-1854(-)